ncbi:hypothetical protein T4A_6179 [Trichinella pseudospiralis]|uniref:Uncharacterized protein n=1 Tax=Trichinella pseudospiralis TaxID=6337 RepID=A0A0V1EWH5_TRIPS|nr:hypothetical protein T4A_6179 [Trichinella pseudospiralis]
MVFKPRRLTTSGWMKLSELPVSIKQFISFPQSKILTTALARESGKVEPTEAKVAPVIVLSEAVVEEETEERHTLA